jgi:Bacterial extracellular solute-binding protein/von Willebrand factor type A domain
MYTLRSVAEGSKRGGRHARSRSRRRRRKGFLRPRWLLLGAALVALVVAIPLVGAVTGPTPKAQPRPGCTGTTEVDLAVDPSLAGPLTRTIEQTVQPALRCVRLVMSVRPSAEVAAEISRRSGQGLAGTLPDLWLPASRMWLAVARSTTVGTQRLSGQFPTVACSPVVVAVSAARVADVRWPAQGPPITALLSANSDASVALQDPSRDTAGLATLLQVGASAPKGGETSAMVNLARRVRVPSSGNALDAVAAGQLEAVPTTERDVITHNEGAAADAQVAAYGGAAPPVADVPLVTIRATGKATPAAGDALAQAAGALRDALLSGSGQSRLEAAGFRGRNGGLDSRFTPVRPLSAVRLPAWSTPDDKQVRSAIHAWGALGRRGRVLVAVDASGSMAGRLPGSTTTKSGLAKKALSAVVSTIAPDSDMGLWTFTASRKRDYHVLVPLGPADGRIGRVSRRQALQSAIGSVRPVPNGGTGLYDTTLAAFRAASHNYAYGRLNAVMVITDGRNEDPGSRSLSQLLTDLRREFDGIKPVRIITVAYGADADFGVLKRIADVTGGASYRAPTAAQVSPLLARALSDL